MYWLDIDKFIPISIENINVINLNFNLYSFTMLVYHSKHLVFFYNGAQKSIAEEYHWYDFLFQQ